MKKLIPLLILLFSSIANAGMYELTIGWDGNTESDLAGYRVYHSKISQEYTKGVDIVADVYKDQTSVTVLIPESVNLDTEYYFSITAYDLSGLESNFSTEVYFVTQGGKVVFVEDNSPPAAPGGCYIQSVRKIN